MSKITIELTEEELFRLKDVFYKRQRDSIAGTDIDIRISDKLLSAHPRISMEAPDYPKTQPSIIPVYFERNALWHFVDFFRLLGESRREDADRSCTRDVFSQIRDAWLSGGEQPSGSEPAHPPRTLKAALRAKDVEMDKLGQTASNLLRLKTQLEAEVTDLRKQIDVWERMHKQEHEVIEQLQTQLAGCLTAAEGATKNPAKQGDFGWSVAYQRTLDLFHKMEEQKREIADLCRFVHEELGGADGETLNVETCILYLRGAFLKAVPDMESRIRVLERDVETAEREAIRIGMDYNKLAAEVTRLFDPAKMTPSRVAYDMLAHAEATLAAAYVVREKCKTLTTEETAATLTLLGESLQAHAVLLDSTLGKHCLPNPLPTLKSELKKALDLHRNTFQKETP